MKMTANVCTLTATLVTFGSLVGGANGQTINLADGIWDFTASGGPASNVGWTNSSWTKGSTSFGAGVVATLEFSQVGSALSSPGDRTLAPDPYLNGFRISNVVNTDSPEPSDNSLQDYKDIKITFSEPVLLQLKLLDIDSSSVQEWNDAVAVEAFSGAYTFSQGLSPDILTYVGSNLNYKDSGGTSSIFSDHPGLDYWWATGGGTLDDIESTLNVGWSTPVNEVHVYYWDRNRGDFNSSTEVAHGISLDAVFASVPEPSSALLGTLAGGLFLLRRRR